MFESRANKPHVLFITRTPGIGKIMVIRRVVARLKGEQLWGFYYYFHGTEPFRHV